MNYKYIWTEINGKKYLLIVFPENDIDDINFILGKSLLENMIFLLIIKINLFMHMI